MQVPAAQLRPENLMLLCHASLCIVSQVALCVQVPARVSARQKPGAPNCKRLTLQILLIARHHQVLSWHRLQVSIHRHGAAVCLSTCDLLTYVVKQLPGVGL